LQRQQELERERSRSMKRGLERDGPDHDLGM